MLSVIIPIHLRCEQTTQCLLSLAQHGANCISEALLVGSESSQPHRSLLSSLDVPFRVRSLSTGDAVIGIGQARNLGVAESTSPFVLFLDNDCLITSRTLPSLIATSHDRPSLTVITALKVDAFTGQRGAGRLLALHRSQSPFSGPRDIIDTDCVFVPRQVAQSTPFDTEFRVGWEDLDWSIQLRRAGVNLYGDGSAVVLHNHSRQNGSTPYNDHRWDPLTIRTSTAHFIDKWGFDPRDFTAEDYITATGCPAESPPANATYSWPAQASAITRLDMNESLAPSPKAVLGSCSPSPHSLRSYNDTAADELTSALARLSNAAPQRIRLFNGAADALFTVLANARTKYRTLFLPSPTWSFYTTLAVHLGYEIVAPETFGCTQTDRSALRSALYAARSQAEPMVWIVPQPHTPTGTLLGSAERDAMFSTANDSQSLLIIDQTYAGFCGTAFDDSLLADYSKAVVVRSFSKAFGLAALRLGWALFPTTPLADWLGPALADPVGSLRAEIALSVLDNMEQYDDRSRLVQQFRKQLTADIADLGTVADSSTNFVLVTLRSISDARSLHQHLFDCGLATRLFDSPGLRSSLRITIPDAYEHFERLQASLRNWRAPS